MGKDGRAEREEEEEEGKFRWEKVTTPRQEF